jgi:hypothetical protein
MEFGAELDGSQDFFQMFWPTILAHKIDEDSPLWDISPRLDAYSMCHSPEEIFEAEGRKSARQRAGQKSAN